MGSFRLRLWIVSVLFCSSLTGWTADSAGSSDPGWKQYGEFQGVRFYRKVIEGSPIYAYRGVGVLKVPLRKVLSAARDINRQAEWVDRLKEGRVVRQISTMDRIEFMHVSTPWPLSDRDFVYRSHLEFEKEKQRVAFMLRSVDDPAAPEPGRRVRGIIHSCLIELRPEEGGTATWISAEVHADPMGLIPVWLVNRIQQSWQRKTILGLLRQMSRPDIPDDPLAIEFFGKPAG